MLPEWHWPPTDLDESGAKDRRLGCQAAWGAGKAGLRWSHLFSISSPRVSSRALPHDRMTSGQLREGRGQGQGQRLALVTSDPAELLLGGGASCSL